MACMVGEENLVVNNKDNTVFCLGTIGLTVSPWKFDVLKTNISPRSEETVLLFK